MKLQPAVYLLALLLPTATAAGNSARPVFIPNGSFLPLYSQKPVQVKAFYLDRFPVSNGEYRAFLAAHPLWTKNQISEVLADSSYLSALHRDPANAAVVHVSWFAAAAYCRAQAKRLPTVKEWEYAASMYAPSINRKILEWYSSPQSSNAPLLGRGMANKLGVADLHGLIWEWTYDFNNALITGESRGDGEINEELYCGGGASRANRLKNYPEFMRYAMRSSLKARYTLSHLGFRCAADAN